MKLNLKKSTG